jgi:hypothetical protein
MNGKHTEAECESVRKVRSWPMRCTILFVLAATWATAGETLYNGIVLPDKWPPIYLELTRDPMREPPYLEEPPKVIPIDLGRQLFVDDFLIESTSLKRTHHLAKYHEASPVFGPDKPWEGKGSRARAGVFSDGIWFDSKDELFKAWYWGGGDEKGVLSTCYATSKDGLVWEKPLLDVVPGTNIVLKDEEGYVRNSSTVWLDHAEKDPARRFKMFRTARKAGQSHHMHISFSPDGIHWTPATKSAECADRSTVFFNPFRNVWVYGLREGHPVVSRCRGYYENRDLIAGTRWTSMRTKDVKRWWIGADELDPPREDLALRRPPDRPWDHVPSQLYNLDCVAYESVLLGLFSIWRGHPADEKARAKINEVCVGYSRDGFHWSRPDRRAFCGVNEDPKAWNHANVQSAGGCCLVVGDKLYFYMGAVNWANGSRHPDPNNTGLAVLRRDGFTSMDAGAEGGTLVTRPVVFSGKHLFVNVDAPKGKLAIEVFDEAGKVIEPFTRANCKMVSVDSTKQEVTWDGVKDLSALAGKPVRLKLHLADGALYSFWVSKDEKGASGGYVGAGGPGFVGARDE